MCCFSSSASIFRCPHTYRFSQPNFQLSTFNFQFSILSGGFMTNEIFKLRSSNPPPRETAFIPHSHPELEIGYFKSGSGIYTVKGHQYEIRSGDIFLFNSDELHKITTVRPDEPMQTLAVLFQPRLVWDALTDDFSDDLLAAFRSLGEAGKHRIDQTHPAYEALIGQIAQIEAEWTKQSPYYRKAVKNRILDFLITLSRSVDRQTKPDESDEAFRDVLPLINASVDEIEEHFCEELRIHDLAAKYGMSQNFFTSCFKKINGITPKAYINSKRIDKAIRLIRSTDKSMLEIATLCGFNSSASFNKSFTKTTGKRPLEYRRTGEADTGEPPRAKT